MQRDLLARLYLGARKPKDLELLAELFKTYLEREGAALVSWMNEMVLKNRIEDKESPGVSSRLIVRA